VAYHVYVFAVTGDPVVQRLLPQLVDAAVERAPRARAINHHDGVAVAGCDLVSSGHGGAIVLNVKTEPGIVKSMVEWGHRFEGAEGLTADTLLTLILVGDMDWRVVRAICEVAVERWSGVICAEGSDTVASLADLP
jgi:hypothetical protein